VIGGTLSVRCHPLLWQKFYYRMGSQYIRKIPSSLYACRKFPTSACTEHVRESLYVMSMTLGSPYNDALLQGQPMPGGYWIHCSGYCLQYVGLKQWMTKLAAVSCHSRGAHKWIFLRPSATPRGTTPQGCKS